VTWLDDHVKRELETFRARFTDEEWLIFRAGGCCHVTEYGTVAGTVHCGESRQHARIYCNPHTIDIRENYPDAPYGALVVPTSVRSMDLSEVA
jgi:hypothetical protein